MEHNSTLEGVLAGIDYNDERKLGDTRNRDTVLGRLVQHFSQVSLRNDRLSDSDIAGFGVFAATPEETGAILDGDPAVRAGIFSYELHPVRGFPGARLP